MEQPPDFRVTGLLPSTGKARPGKIPQTPGLAPSDLTGRLTISNTSTRMPVVIPPDKKKKKKQPTRPELAKPRTIPFLKKLNKFHKLDRRITWYIVSIVGILTVVLGFVFAVPLNTGQQESSTLAQGFTNLITNGQSGSVASQSRAQGKAKGQSPFTPGYSNSGTSPSRLFSNSSPWNVAIGNNVQLDPQFRIYS